MKINKIYKPITNLEITELRQARQVFSDCYLVSTLNSLSRTAEGRKILKTNISKRQTGTSAGYKICFQDVYGTPKDVFVTDKEIDNLVDKYFNVVKHDIKKNKTLKAVEVAMGKLINDHPFLKSIVNRCAFSDEAFEYNTPSRFMKLFTGKKPIALNEQTLNLTLSSKKENAAELLKQIAKADGEQNFIAGTSAFVSHPNIKNWHCYVLEKVNPDNNAVTVYDTRTTETYTLSFTSFIKSFKYITGFFSKDLK